MTQASPVGPSSQEAIWFGLLLVQTFALSALLAAAPDAYTSVNTEDSWIENMTAIMSLAAGVVLVLVFRAETVGLRRACFLAAAIAFVLVAGEEISWGQRILGLETPEQWKELNEQDETNLHNLNVRLFNNVWQAAIYVLVVLTLGMAALRRSELFGFRLPSLPIVLGFVFVLVYRTHRTLFDFSMHDLADLACWLLVVGAGVQALRLKNSALALIAALTAVGTPMVIYVNHLNNERVAINTISEAQEYLFLFLCLAYSLELLRHARSSRPSIAG